MKSDTSVMRWGVRILLVAAAVVAVAAISRPRAGQASGRKASDPKQGMRRAAKVSRTVSRSASPDRAPVQRERPTSSVRSMGPSGTLRPATGGRQPAGSATNAGGLCHQAGNCQAPDNSDAKRSNRTDFIAVDDYRPAASGDVTSICWWGTYARDSVTMPGGLEDCYTATVVDTFQVKYCNDAGGHPGTTCTTFSQTSGTLTVTGPTLTGSSIAGFLPEFAFSATHAAFSVTSGQCYWIEITNDSGTCEWFWEVSPEGGDWSLLDGDGINPPDGHALDEFELLDYAFCVNIALDETFPCGPPADPFGACPNPAQDCCVPDPDEPPNVTGCQDDLCCRRVCACDPACCDLANGWDTFCATTGLNENGCGAEVLCTQECSPCGDPSTGDCCTDTGSASCDDLTCCETVCAADPFCCETQWDNICASEALELCPQLCAPPTCGNPATGSCCDASPFQIGCSDATCCEAVCAQDQACCMSSPGWDANCATLGFGASEAGALYLCDSLCNPCTLCGDMAGDGVSVNGAGSNTDLADYAAFVDCLGVDLRSRPECFCSDLNRDKAVTPADYPLLAPLFENTSALRPPNCSGP